MSRLFLLLTFGCLLLASCTMSLPEDVETAYKKLPEKIDFNYHVRPLLSDRCYACHGPDENTRKAGLRLDIADSAFARLQSGSFALRSGKPGSSESIRRILSDDPDYQMPPPDSHLQLNPSEKAMLVKWVEQGARWQNHWAFIPPRQPPVPAPANPNWTSHNPIDRFVQKKLPSLQLAPAAEAEKERLIRRVSMDLTGLPPTLEEIDAFLADTSEAAFENVVDRLLGTDAAAERLALDWLDLSRYADSHGLHADGWRLMWPWRDWVIDAFRKNMPYDQFVTLQLAGDLMPGAGTEEKLATAFNRNHPMTAEGGAIEEEFRLNYVWDRSETVGTAVMGLTINCARCHDHKFDPVSQKNYYEMAAFFNNVKELGMTGDDGNYGPLLPLPNENTAGQLRRLENEISQGEQQIGLSIEEMKGLEKYMATLPESHSGEGLIAHYPFDGIKPAGKNGGYFIDGQKDAYAREAPGLTEGKVGNALSFTGEYDEVSLQGVPNFEWTDPFSLSLWINTSKRKAGLTQTLAGTSGDKNNFWRGWDFFLDSLNRVNVRLIHSLPHNYLHLRSLDSIPVGKWKHLAFTYDGSGDTQGIKLYADGKPFASESVFNQLYKSIQTIRSATHVLFNQPVRVAKSYRGFTGENGIFIGAMDDLRIYRRKLVPQEVGLIFDPHSYKSVPAPEYWIARDDSIRSLRARVRGLREEWLETMGPVMEVMVMEDMQQYRRAFAYDRGDYQQPLYEVVPGTPEVLPEFPEDLPKNRLGLAKWLFSPGHPLTARVAVNRYWMMLFGKGLVTTPQDFGVQGALPSHPELLDWLAREFENSDWNVKGLLKTMVMSHTYRQSSAVEQAVIEKDPTNHYLTRSNSYRWPAEMIRDNALAASGLLVREVGGESVKPYQPPDLWIEQTNFSHKLLRYRESGGDSIYRRGMYTFIRRTAPHPAMTAFDAPNREVCTIKRENTNTPLQALVLLNDTQFVEASKMLAARMVQEGGGSLKEQLMYGFRLATSRKPREGELQVLESLYQGQLNHYTQQPKEAGELLSVGRKTLNPALDKEKTAAMTVVANTLLNFDDTYMKR